MKEIVFKPIVVERKNVRVRLYYIGEGLNGDFNSLDKNDKAILRFSIDRKEVNYKTDTIAKEWKEIKDASYCTLLQIDNYRDLLIKIANVIMANVFRKAEYDKSIKEICERLSHIELLNIEKFAHVKIEPTKCAGHFDLHAKPYSCENILIRQYNFPANVFDYEELCCVYNDRIYHKWREAIDWLKKEKGEEAKYETVFDDVFLEWGKIIFKNWLDIISRELTGLRVVRYTNISSGFPVMRIDGYSHNPIYPDVSTYDSNYDAPNILEIEEDPRVPFILPDK